MSQSSTEIERVVREVLAELGAAPKSTDGRCDDKNCKELASRDAVDGTLTVNARVVTINDIGGRLDAVRHLVVPCGAIVTPAVRDELLRRGIALECAASPNHQPAAIRLLLIDAGAEFDPTALRAALAREGFSVECSGSDCLIAATDQLAAEVSKPDTLGVLLTPHLGAAICLANRLRGVRAISGDNAPAVAAAAAAVGANLLVADPRAGSFFQLKQIITEFGRDGVRPCPRVFEKRLA